MTVWSYYADRQLKSVAFFSFDKSDLHADTGGNGFIPYRKIIRIVNEIGDWRPPTSYGADFDPDPILSPSLPKCRRALVEDIFETWK